MKSIFHGGETLVRLTLFTTLSGKFTGAKTATYSSDLTISEIDARSTDGMASVLYPDLSKRTRS